MKVVCQLFRLSCKFANLQTDTYSPFITGWSIHIKTTASVCSLTRRVFSSFYNITQIVIYIQWPCYCTVHVYINICLLISVLLLEIQLIRIWIWILVFNITFNNISAISWWPILVVEEAGVPGENHRPWESNC